MEDMLKIMGIEAGSGGKGKGPAAVKVKKKKEGSSDGSAMDSQVSQHGNVWSLWKDTQNVFCYTTQPK